MKRFLVLCSAVALCGLISGCTADSHEGLVKSTIEQINLAANKVDDIRSLIDSEVKKVADGDSKKLDFKLAIEATKELEKAGKESQELRRRIEKVRAQVSEKEQQNNFEKHKPMLNTAFSELLKKRNDLRDSLEKAAALQGQGNAVKDLREEIAKAEAPFEALSR